MSFDTLAAVYGGIERVCAGGLMQRARIAHLEACPPEGEVLLVGEGHGRILYELRRRRPGLKLTYLDASPKMAAVARRRLATHGLNEQGISYLTGDVLTCTLEPSRYDVIVTPFLLDCFLPEELALLIPRLTLTARPGAIWMVSDFQLPPSGWKRRRAKIIHFLLHSFFRQVTGISARKWTDPDDLLRLGGWELQNRYTHSWDLLRSDLWTKTPLPA